MNKILLAFVLSINVVLAGDAPAGFRKACGNLFRIHDDANIAAAKGKDGFYFLPRELRSYSVGEFWGPAAADACVAEKNSDPLPAILDFNRMLKSKGIELILVPVPGKVVTYPDSLFNVEPEPRLDELHQKFYALLEKEGVQVIDILPELLAMRKKGVQISCKQDTHWSPVALEACAKKVGEAVKKQAWHASVTKQTATFTDVMVEFEGDFAPLLPADKFVKEKMTIKQVKLGGSFIESDRDSPLVLIGDSNLLVFHTEMLGEHGGLADHIAAETGIGPENLGVMGGGANASRITLARRKDNMAGKKCVVWCFTAREFTEAQQGWNLVPVIR